MSICLVSCILAKPQQPQCVSEASPARTLFSTGSPDCGQTAGKSSGSWGRRSRVLGLAEWCGYNCSSMCCAGGVDLTDGYRGCIRVPGIRRSGCLVPVVFRLVLVVLYSYRTRYLYPPAATIIRFGFLFSRLYQSSICISIITVAS